MVTDKIGLPEVVAFVESKLAGYDLARLDWFKLLPLGGRYWRHGRCTYPVRERKGSRRFKSGYQVRCSVHVEPPCPLAVEVTTGTWQSGDQWGYFTRRIVFADRDELAVWLAGHEAFHFLRHSRQVPGRNTEPSANRFGIGWLAEYRQRQ